MGLRCSLLGHDYGEPEQEAEQERRGGEKVLTVREFRRCARCGAETVVSENTEVTPVHPDSGGAGADADPVRGAASAAPDDPSPPPAEEPSPAADGPDDGEGTVEDDAIILDDEPADEGTAATADSGTDPVDGDADDPVADAPVPEEDADGGGTSAGESAPDDADDTPAETGGDSDAVAADAPEELGSGEPDEEPPASGTREWPAADDVGAPEDGTGDGEPPAWPEPRGEDEGFDAEPSDGEGPAVEFGGLTPEAADVDGTGDDEWVGDEAYVGGDGTGPTVDGDGDDAGAATGSVEGVGITSAGPVERSETRVDAVLVCPECGFRQGAVASSLREGDICPEPDCGRGYLTERDR